MTKNARTSFGASPYTFIILIVNKATFDVSKKLSQSLPVIRKEGYYLMFTTNKRPILENDILIVHTEFKKYRDWNVFTGLPLDWLKAS